MLLSPLSLDSNTLSGPVPALPASGAGAATGFAEQLQLAAAMPPADASAPVAIPAAASSLPLNSVGAGNATPLGAPIAFHSTTELNIRGVVFSSMVADAAPRVGVGSTAAPAALVAAPEIVAAPVVTAPETSATPATPQAAPEAPATPIPASNVPAADVKPQEKIVPALQDAAPAIEEAPILASGLPQKSSAPAGADRVEHKRDADTDTPDAQPQPQAQTAVPLAAPAPLPVHMVLPISSRFNRSLTPLGNRIPVGVAIGGRGYVPAEKPVLTEKPAADPFHTDSDKDPQPAALRAETARPLIATADQLAFAAKVQLAKPQTLSNRVSEAPAAARSVEPVRHEQHSQQNSSHGDSDSPFSMKPGEPAAKSGMRPAQPASHFESIGGVAGETIAPAKTSKMPDGPASAAAAEDVTPTRPEVPAAPMKDISVRIQSEQGENVDVRILHRAGDVQIAVTSASGETTQGLRHGLSELSDRLNAAGYHADTWHPGQPATAANNPADSGGSQQQQNSQQQQSQGDSQSHSGWSQQHSGQRDGNQPNRPHWIDELESNISSPAETGLFHGLIR